jgi:hypothetical protein
LHKEILRQDRLGTTIANSVDPQHPAFVPPHLLIFPVEVQKRWIQMIDAKPASNCWRRRPNEANWDQFIWLGPSWDQKTQFCGRIQLV